MIDLLLLWKYFAFYNIISGLENFTQEDLILFMNLLPFLLTFRAGIFASGGRLPCGAREQGVTLQEEYRAILRSLVRICVDILLLQG